MWYYVELCVGLIFIILFVLLICFEMICLLKCLFVVIARFKFIGLFGFSLLSEVCFKVFDIMFVVNWFFVNEVMVKYILFIVILLFKCMFWSILLVWIVMIVNLFCLLICVIFFIFLIMFVNIILFYN